ncbi:sterol homeostasis protein ARV1 NDAI_0G02180 [Naumovozyma dairenensis CBS 421]|uniref:Protein ARV n=1 Tax=Naumovozyma dairenensis (strain ATCC 10597 / BCRC 20456 / CBS 421 / NBRC 0211 / NRRL Y-12639) TaxID=1071378 RepID=G0WDY2_NAUDC|nr:hypothetical protein NDAI_0G02180 [Naumovozyma dairenensis CBS 421]CCD25993.2 hypothetical protein NDAI_0G02180 [Naumovozyma dairenensis CBS 421]
MICIECGAAVDSLYTVYSNKHIQLTECSQCHNIVDKYVEFDNVLMFIDLLLLKPGAYRHLVFNSLEERLSKYKESKPLQGPLRSRLLILRNNIRNWLLKFDDLNRLWLLLLTFEIYLTWFTEDETPPHKRSLLMSRILTENALIQYAYFTLYCLIDISMFHYLIQYFIISWCKWGTNVKNAKHVISYTILLSYGAKIFPILMLIWPYDTILSMSIIKWVANFYIVESLRIVTNLSYFTILRIFTFVSFARYTCTKPILILFVSKCNIHLMKTYLKSEIDVELLRLESLKYFITG